MFGWVGPRKIPLGLASSGARSWQAASFFSLPDKPVSPLVVPTFSGVVHFECRQFPCFVVFFPCELKAFDAAIRIYGKDCGTRTVCYGSPTGSALLSALLCDSLRSPAIAGGCIWACHDSSGGTVTCRHCAGHVGATTSTRKKYSMFSTNSNSYKCRHVIQCWSRGRWKPEDVPSRNLRGSSN